MQFFLGTADRRASKRFLCVLAGALSTRHTWHAIVALDLYTRNRFSESMRSQFGGPGQKGTASNDRVHSFCGFLPNPLIQDLFL